MKVLIFSPGAYKKYGHSFDYCKGLAEACLNLGIDVTVFGYDGPLSFNPKIDEKRIGVDGVYKRSTSIYGRIKWGIDRINGSNWFLEQLINHLDSLEEKPFVIFETFEYLSLRRKLSAMDIHYSCIFHDTNFNFKQSNFLAGVYKFLCRVAVKKIIQDSSKSFVHGKAMKKNLVKQLGNHLSGQISVLPYGAPNPIKVSDQDKEKSKEKLGLSSDKKYMLSFGTLRQDKNFDEVVEALTQNDDWNWLIAGPEGDLKYDYILKKAKAFKVENKLTIHNKFIENKDQRDYFEAADVVVNLYKDYIRHESGTAQLARTFNKPLIVSGPPDLISYVEDKGIGWITNEEASINKILNMYDGMGEQEKKQISNNIYDLALQNSWNKVLDLILKAVDLKHR